MTEREEIQLEERGRPLPLNSKRLKCAQLQQLARALNLPISASADEIRQMIVGKLEEMDREPYNVQVVVQHEVGGTRAYLRLQDSTGIFLEAPPIAPEPEDHDATGTTHFGVGEETATSQHEMGEDEGNQNEVQVLRQQLQQSNTNVEALTAEVAQLKIELTREKDRVKELWRMNCEQLEENDSLVTAKEDEIASLTARINQLVQQCPVTTEVEHHTRIATRPIRQAVGRKGKAPPIDAFTNENPDIRLEDWLPSLNRAASWNGWTEEEQLMQLAGHLRGRALLEWNLIQDCEKSTFTEAVQALHNRLDPGGRALAAQDFRHVSQGETEPVADFIRRLERTFAVAYGRDRMSLETRDTLLHSQLQEGLRYELMKGPAVSGAQAYKDLCLAAKNEERRIAELRKRARYHKPPATFPRRPEPSRSSEQPQHWRKHGNNPAAGKTCSKCHQIGHFARDCRNDRAESRGSPVQHKTKSAHARQIQASQNKMQDQVDPVTCLFSSTDSEDTDNGAVKVVHVKDGGSRPQCVRVLVQGVPAVGLIDSGADITIMGGTLFRKIAAAAKLKKKEFQKADKIPRGYDQRPFQLDGRMDLNISFGEHAMKTPIYLKMDAHDQLLLSEGVCRQLGIISYHSEVEPWRGGRQRQQSRTTEQASTTNARVPTVRVRLVQSVQSLPSESRMARVQIGSRRHPQISTLPATGPLLLERSKRVEGNTCLWIEDSLLKPRLGESHAQVTLFNPTGFTQVAKKGLTLGIASPVDIVPPFTLQAPSVKEESVHNGVTKKFLTLFLPHPPAWSKEK